MDLQLAQSPKPMEGIMHLTLRKSSDFITRQGKIFYFQEQLSTSERPIVVDLQMLVTEGRDLQRLLTADERLLAFAKNLHQLPFLRDTVFFRHRGFGCLLESGASWEDPRIRLEVFQCLEDAYSARIVLS